MDGPHTETGYPRSKGLPEQDRPCSKGKDKKTPDRSVVAQEDHLKYTYPADRKKDHIQEQSPHDPRPEQSPYNINDLIGQHHRHAAKKGPQKKNNLIFYRIHYLNSFPKNELASFTEWVSEYFSSQIFPSRSTSPFSSVSRLT